jgi:asparagine synthase (glutamine-hydrolysing)
MCGIAGIYRFDHGPVGEDVLTAMRETMVHRGPDGFGNYVAGHVGLAHRRLSIVDLGGGHQPMSNEDGTVWVSFNGEIYNHNELRPALVAKGHVFRTSSDTEVLVHLYEEHGDDLVQKLKGMFAFAIWDARRDRVLLARDRIGIKPLYYHATAERLLFGSEIKALLAHPDMRPEMNSERLGDYLLYGSVYGAETLFRDIYELEPGHVMSIDARGPALRRYWDLPEGPVSDEDEATQRERLEDLLRISIRRRLMSDVPLGAFLSGGVDSSLIVALMAEMIDTPVKTFSIGFAESGYNEFNYSRYVAETFHTDHLEITLDSREFFDALPRLTWHYDEPIALAACIPLYFLSRATKGKATVILTGEGADELLLGYEKYAWAHRHATLASRFQRMLPAGAHLPLARAAQRLLGPSRLLLGRLPLAPGDVASSFYQVVRPDVVAGLFDGRGAEIHAALQRHRVGAEMFDAAPAGRDFLARMSYMDFKTFLVTLLMKQDKMSMAASIESRVPFLDHELVEYGYRLPTTSKVAGDVHKKILKDVAARHLPHDLLHREKKGFPVPVTPWFLQPATRKRFEEILLDDRTARRGIVNRAAVERHFREVAAGERGSSSAATYLIWYLVNLELWQQVFFDAAPARVTDRRESSVRLSAGAL